MHDFLANACFTVPPAVPPGPDPLAAVRRSFGEGESSAFRPVTPPSRRLRRPPPARRRRPALVA